jgi:hypothetical protein
LYLLSNIGGKQDKVVKLLPGCTIVESQAVKDELIIDGIDN